MIAEIQNKQEYAQFIKEQDLPAKEYGLNGQNDQGV